MKVSVNEKNEVTIIHLEGNIDINASSFIETVGRTLINRSKYILCDFSEVNLVDYVGISIIAVAYKNILNHKGKMKLCNVPSHVRKLFSIVGMDGVLEMYESEEQAIASFTEEKIFSQILKKQLRRRFQRMPLRAIIEYKQKFSSKDLFYKGKVINLSGIGAFILAQKIFSIGEILTTRIHLFSKSAKTESIEIDAKIVWVSDRKIQPREYPGMGIEFYNIDPQTQQKFVKFVERNITRSD